MRVGKQSKQNNREDCNVAKRYRNRVRLAVRNAKADFIRSNSDRYENDAKTFWDNIAETTTCQK